MTEKAQPNNPLHGKTLESILKDLVEKYGWEVMGEKIKNSLFYGKSKYCFELKIS